MAQKLTTEQFIQKAKKKWGDKFDYSKVNYQGTFNKVEIICAEHGSFFQSPNNHLHGFGCLFCAGTQPSNSKDFIKKSLLKHGDKYNYSLVEYIDCYKKVIIVCKEHGKFEQSPTTHLANHGCPDCGYVVRGESNALQHNDFIDRAIEKHGNYYDYSKTKYERNVKKVTIICPKHGEFTQTGSNHLAGQGCSKCGDERVSSKCRSTTEEFIDKAIKKHGDKYIYDQVNYITDRKNIEIICPEHGSFWQRPNNHLGGKGCKSCALQIVSKKNSENPNGWSWSAWEKQALKSKNFHSFKVYIIRCWNDEEEFYKIGRTFKTVKARFNEKSSIPYNYELIKIIEHQEAIYICELEKQLQRENKNFKYLPKISFAGVNECFSNVCRTS